MLVPLTLTEKFTAVLEGACRTAFAHYGDGGRTDWTIRLIWHYLRRTIHRFAAIAARNGAPAPSRKPPAHPPLPEPTEPRQIHPARPRRSPRMPTGGGWFIRTFHFSGVCCRELKALIEDPEMQALLAISADARRLIRPLAQMINLHPFPPILRKPTLRLPPVEMPQTKRFKRPKSPWWRPSDEVFPADRFRPPWVMPPEQPEQLCFAW